MALTNEQIELTNEQIITINKFLTKDKTNIKEDKFRLITFDSCIITLIQKNKNVSILKYLNSIDTTSMPDRLVKSINFWKSYIENKKYINFNYKAVIFELNSFIKSLDKINEFGLEEGELNKLNKLILSQDKSIIPKHEKLIPLDQYIIDSLKENEFIAPLLYKYLLSVFENVLDERVYKSIIFWSLYFIDFNEKVDDLDDLDETDEIYDIKLFNEEEVINELCSYITALD